MNGDKDYKDTPSPDRFVHRDVSNLETEFVRIKEQLNNMKENTVTKSEFANWKFDSLKWVVQLVIPLFAVSLGAALAQYLGK